LVDTIAVVWMSKKRQRRFWSEDEKRRIVSQARLPGVSVSVVARRYDVNANLVFKWLRDPRFQTEVETARFLPVEVVAATAAVVEPPRPEASRIVIELATGHRLTVSGGFDPDRVVQLVRGLTS
jgi:transposase